ncbi:MAG: MarR family transcriptional regulator [Methanomicrobiales archaeon]|nr:MarR family transcriptional regulator [Methanomicrobiales archaeon]
MPVKDEDVDWIVYHILSNGGAKTEASLVGETGLPAGDIVESLTRLELNLLIECRNGTYDILSIPEMLFRCQCRHSQDMPVIIEDGVIKVKKTEP